MNVKLCKIPIGISAKLTRVTPLLGGGL